MYYFFTTSFHFFVCLAISYSKKFESKLKPSSNALETKSMKAKILQSWKEKQEIFITTKWIRRKEKIGIFTKQELEKKCNGEDERPLNVPNKIKACECYVWKLLWCFSIWSWAFLFSDRATQRKKVLFDQVSWGYQITQWRRRMSQKKFDSV